MDRASSTHGWSVISAFLYLAYIGFFAYVAWAVRRMDAIHSRLGITFTALVEIAVSTVTSLSVCALVGFKITLVPWQVTLPPSCNLNDVNLGIGRFFPLSSYLSGTRT